MSAFPSPVWVHNPGGSKKEKHITSVERTYKRSTDQTNERQCKHFLSEKVGCIRAVNCGHTVLYSIQENSECMALLTIY